VETGAGAGGGALTAISAAKAGVPINAMVAIAVASFFMTATRSTQNLPYGLPGGCYRFSTVKWKILDCQAALRVIAD
jgi:hypothetical protein